MMPGRLIKNPRTQVHGMVERRSELNRRYHRKQKLKKLKAKLAKAKDGRERDNVLRKIRLLSPWWTETRTKA
jgi:hypothetical protein